MKVWEIILAGAIILGALYLLYRSIWKRQGFCPGCTSEPCSTRGNSQKTLEGAKKS